MSGSAFENSIKRKIYVLAAVKDSDECKRLRKKINIIAENILNEGYVICMTCITIRWNEHSENGVYNTACGYCTVDICKYCPQTDTCDKCNERWHTYCNNEYNKHEC